MKTYILLNLYSSTIWATNTTIPEMKRTQCTFNSYINDTTHLLPFMQFECLNKRRIIIEIQPCGFGI